MEKQPAAHVIAAERSEVRAPRSEHAPSPVSASLQAGPAAAHLAARNPYAGRRHDERRAETARTFNSVVCVVAGVPTDEAARYQAARLASPGGNVELVSAAQVTRDGQYVLGDSYDLLAVGRSAAAFAAVQHARIPILIARKCPLGTEVTDTIVVPVDDSPEPSGALEIAALLAAAHGGTVTLLAAPRSDPALQRAITASVGVVLDATGVAPHVIGEPRPPEVAIPSAAATLNASLVVLDSGDNAIDRTTAALMVGAIGCSVLVVPRS